MIEKILELMSQKGVTAREVCTSAGLTHSAISDWKKGKSKPSTDALVKIAEYFNVSTDYLLGRSVPPLYEKLNVPDSLKSVQIAFNRPVFNDLTQEQVDKVANIVETLKQQGML